MKSFPVAQWVKNPALLQQWLRLELRLRFSPRNFHMPWVWQKKKLKNNYMRFMLGD